MSRIAKQPVAVPAGVDVKVAEGVISVKGSKGELTQARHPLVVVEQDGNELQFSAQDDSKQGWAQAGTLRSLVSNMVQGVTQGFERSLDLVGVGYRAQVSGKKLNLTLGFSHPVEVAIPKDLSVETPSQTRVVVKGIDKQRVGQLAAEIRKFRPPEPYKGKGVRYTDEWVRRKEAKKK